MFVEFGYEKFNFQFNKNNSEANITKTPKTTIINLNKIISIYVCEMKPWNHEIKFNRIMVNLSGDREENFDFETENQMAEYYNELKKIIRDKKIDYCFKDVSNPINTIKFIG